MSSERPDMIESLQLTTDANDFHWMSQGVTKVEGMNDKEEFDFTDVNSTYCYFLNITHQNLVNR